MNDPETMARGLLAIRELDRHADVIATGERGGCRECQIFALALIRGDNPTAALHLRCAPAQQWHAAITAAYAVAERLCE